MDSLSSLKSSPLSLQQRDDHGDDDDDIVDDAHDDDSSLSESVQTMLRMTMS